MEEMLTKIGKYKLSDVMDTITEGGFIANLFLYLGEYITENPWRIAYIIFTIAILIFLVIIIYIHNCNKPYSTVKKIKNKKSTTEKQNKPK